jgi:Ser/Thr protein kinase RdoA (MazF antagonist)
MKGNTEQTSHFPITRSIVSADALANVLERAYGFAVSRCQLIKAVVLDTYQVTTPHGPYILRIYPAQRRTATEITAELDFLAYLHAAGVSVSIPVHQHNGERLLTLLAPEGTRQAVLFTYAPGQPLKQNVTTTAIRTYGQALARVHAIADTLPQALPRPPLDLQMLLERPIAELGAAFADRSTDWTFLRHVADVLKPKIAALPTTPPQYGLCHGDTSAANVHVAADGQVTLFDFDFCGPGWRAYDIGTFLVDESPDVAQAFLEGYQDVRVLTADEQAAIPLFQVAQNIWVLGMRASYVNEWGSTHFSDRLVNHIFTFIKSTMARIDAL